MPKVPVYELQVRGGGGGISSPDFINLSTPYANAVSGIGNIITQRGEHLLDQFDQTAAMDAANEYRELARGKLEELKKREGLDANGIQQEYQSWSMKARDDIIKSKLDVATQQRYFNNLTTRRTEADLDNLASHEFTQLTKAKAEKFDGFTSQTLKDIRTNAVNDARVTEMIGEWEVELANKYPGMDHTEKINKFKMSARYGQVEDLIQTNPKAAAVAIERYKDDLQHGYIPLKNQLEKEQKESRVTDVYHMMASQFGPEAAVNQMRNEAWMNKNFPDLKLEERERVINAFKAQVLWNKQMKQLREDEITDSVFKGVQERMRTGDVKGAEELLYRADGMDPAKAAVVQNYIYTARNRFDDQTIVEKIKSGINDLSIKTPSEVDMYVGHGVSEQTGKMLREMVADRWKNPDRQRFIQQAMDYYKKEFGQFGEMVMLMPYVETWIRNKSIKENLQGDQIMDEFIKFVGTKDQLYNKGWFDSFTLGLGWAGAGQKASTAPVGGMIEGVQQERKAAKEGKSTPAAPAGGTPFPKITTPETMTKPSVDAIPQPVKAKIVEILQNSGKSVNDQSILQFYKQNQNKLEKYNTPPPASGS